MRKDDQESTCLHVRSRQGADPRDVNEFSEHLLTITCSMLKIIQLAILLAASGPLHGYTGRGTRCSVASRGITGSITCHFSANLNVTKQDFSVRSSRLNGRHADWVVDCSWADSGRTACFVHPSYQFNGEVSGEAVIQISEMKDEDDTKYWCQVVPSEYSLVEPCSVKPPERSRPPQATANQETPKYETDANRTSTVFQAAPPALLLGSLLLSLLLWSP